MKKILFALLPLLAALSACNFPEDNFTMTNVSDYATVSGDLLISDRGIAFTVTADLTDGNWKTDGERIYAIFDVTDSKLNITLNSYVKAIVRNPEADPDDTIREIEDPVEIKDCGIGATGYLNLMIGFYALEESTSAHNMTLYWKDDGKTLSFQLIHSGDGENPTKMDESSLTSLVRIYSFPITEIVPSGETRMVTLTADILGKDAEGNYSITRTTADLYNSVVHF